MSKLIYRLIPFSTGEEQGDRPVEDGGYFWPNGDCEKRGSKIIVEFMVVSVVALLTTALCDPDPVVETKMLSRLLGL